MSIWPEHPTPTDVRDLMDNLTRVADERDFVASLSDAEVSSIYARATAYARERVEDDLRAPHLVRRELAYLTVRFLKAEVRNGTRRKVIEALPEYLRGQRFIAPVA